MEITVSRVSGRVPVTVIRLVGKLDGASYESAIAKGNELYGEGDRNFVIDLSETSFISSAGLVALHTIALTARGEKLPDSDMGWGALRSVDRERSKGKSQNVKLASPQERVTQIFDIAGFAVLFDIFPDLQSAIDSF